MTAYKQRRNRVQFLCFLVFCLLPFFNVLRIDIPKERIYFAGYELWISEFIIVYFILMFLLFVIAAVSIIYGRIYCSYLCPQMIFSDASLALEERLRRYVNKHYIGWPARRRALAVRVVLYAAVLVASVFLAFIFISYFVDPRDLFHRLLSFDIQTAGGVAGATTTLFTFLDLAFVRHRFCTSACPYGYLQGMLADSHTLLVAYDGPGSGCIECKKCVRVCHMAIDIRNSAHQIQCIHCGDCIDACNEVLGRLKKPKPGLIGYVWGDSGVRADVSAAWYKRLGIRDAKRAIVIGVLVFYASGLLYALSSRRTVLIRLMPDRTRLYEIAANGDVLNRFRLRVSNRGGQDTKISIALDGLPGARLTLTENPLRTAPGSTRDVQFNIAAPPNGPAPGVNHFQFIARSAATGNRESIPMTFIMPERKPN